MTRLVVRRLLQLPLILGVIYTLTLALAWGVPGNPLDNPEGRRPPPEVQEAMLARYRLDSFWSFYASYLEGISGVRWVRDEWNGTHERRRAEALSLGQPDIPAPIFDLGPSLQYRDRTVNEIIGASLPVSVTLGAVAITVALVLGLVAGIAGALRPGSWLDIATLGVAIAGISLPTFVVGVGLLLVFGVWLRLTPVGLWDPPRSIVLPAITLSVPYAAYIARLTRLSMLEALGADYIRTARAKGLPERSVVLRHALKNAFLPVLSYLGPAAAMAMTGSFVVEVVFNVPGLGQHFVNAVQNKDLFLAIGVVMAFSTMVVIFNLGVDLLYRWVDPRIA